MGENLKILNILIVDRIFMRNQKDSRKLLPGIGSLNAIVRVETFLRCWGTATSFIYFIFGCCLSISIIQMMERVLCVFKQLPSVILLFFWGGGGYFWFWFRRLPTSIPASIHHPLTFIQPLTFGLDPDRIETKGRNSSRVNSAAHRMPRWKRAELLFPPSGYLLPYTYDYANCI